MLIRQNLAAKVRRKSAEREGKKREKVGKWKRQKKAKEEKGLARPEKLC